MSTANTFAKSSSRIAPRYRHRAAFPTHSRRHVLSNCIEFCGGANDVTRASRGFPRLPGFREGPARVPSAANANAGGAGPEWSLRFSACHGRRCATLTMFLNPS